MPTISIHDQCSNSSCPRGVRPPWAGPVEITWEEIMHVTSGRLARITSVAGIVVPGSTSGRKGAPEPSSGFRVSQSRPPEASLAVSGRNTGRPDLDKGHLMALELGGPDIPENIVPQWSNWQRNGRWRQMEKAVLAEATAIMKQGTQALAYCVIVVYHQYRNNAIGNYDRLRVPKKFIVATAPVAIASIASGLGQLQWTPVFDEEQRQDETDDRMAERAAHPKPKQTAKRGKRPTATPPLRTGMGTRGLTRASHGVQWNATVGNALPQFAGVATVATVDDD